MTNKKSSFFQGINSLRDTREIPGMLIGVFCCPRRGEGGGSLDLPYSHQSTTPVVPPVSADLGFMSIYFRALWSADPLANAAGRLSSPQVLLHGPCWPGCRPLSACQDNSPVTLYTEVLVLSKSSPPPKVLWLLRFTLEPLPKVSPHSGLGVLNEF